MADHEKFFTTEPGTPERNRDLFANDERRASYFWVAQDPNGEELAREWTGNTEHRLDELDALPRPFNFWAVPFRSNTHAPVRVVLDAGDELIWHYVVRAGFYDLGHLAEEQIRREDAHPEAGAATLLYSYLVVGKRAANGDVHVTVIEPDGTQQTYDSVARANRHLADPQDPKHRQYVEYALRIFGVAP